MPATPSPAPVTDLAETRLAKRGYHVTFRQGAENRCPGCGRSHWYVGRVSAECAFCGTAVPLAEAA